VRREPLPFWSEWTIGPFLEVGARGHAFILRRECPRMTRSQEKMEEKWPLIAEKLASISENAIL